MIAYPDNFNRQFLVARADDLPTIPDAIVHRLNAVAVAIIADLPIVRVVARDGSVIGCFLGHPVNHRQGCVVRGELRVDQDVPAGAEIDDFVEKIVYDHSGSFIFILDLPGARRVYLDADGSLSAVFDPTRNVCAATTGLLVNEAEYRARFRQDLYDFLAVSLDGWFPAGLTAHEGISRLMCNHYLDLEAGGQHRHWPLAQIGTTSDPDAACRRIAQLTADTIKALLNSGRITTTLTAGNETRLILAACKAFKDDLNFYTVNSIETRLDAVRAQELASRFGLKHRLLQVRFATAEQSAQWHARAGHCIGGPNMRSFPTVAPLSEFDYVTGGLGGEIGRAFFWRPTDTETTPLSAHEIVVRFGMPVHDAVVAAVEEWLRHVPPCDSYFKLDLAYLELRMSCWAFAQSYATPNNCAIHPLISRESFTAMLSLPPEWRRANRMILRGIELAWPEVLDLPINRYGDYRDMTRQVFRALRNPRLVVKKLRKRFG